MLKKEEKFLRVSASDRTFEELPLPDEIGENTDRLSDVSDNECDEMLYSTHRATTWMQRLGPLLRSPCVRAYAIANLVIFLLNLVVLNCVLVLLVFAIYHKVRTAITLSYDRPCLYHWTNWEPCSASCYSGVGPPPNMTRQVDKRSIVQARGKFMDTLPCPADLVNRVDYAPCNTHLCSRRLSEFAFVGPFRADIDYTNACYDIRNITRGNYLLHIDTTELIRPVKCVDLNDTDT